MQSLLSLIRQAERITLTSHIHPDGDAVGSVLALHFALEQLSKTVHSGLLDGAPAVFSFLPGKENIESELRMEEADLIIALDVSDVSRTGFAEQLRNRKRGQKVAVIDHHPRGDLLRIAATSYRRENASSTAELVYDLITQLDIRLTPSIATCLLTGLYTDTGGFQHPNTTTEVMELAAELMRRGGRLNTIVRHLSRNKTICGLKLLGLVLQRVRVTRQGQCALSFLTHEEISSCGGTAEDLSGIVNELNVLPGVRFALLLTELEPGTVRGTLRSGEGQKANVHHLARLLGGGGHPRAAGFSVSGHLTRQNDSWQILPPIAG